MLCVYIWPNKIHVDNRHIIGGNISALTCHVTHLSEYSRRYSTNAKKKRVGSGVTSLDRYQIKTGQSSTYIHCEFDFESGTKNKAVLFIS